MYIHLSGYDRSKKVGNSLFAKHMLGLPMIALYCSKIYRNP